MGSRSKILETMGPSKPPSPIRSLNACSERVLPATMEKCKIRVIYEYEFRRGTTGSETARNINAVFGEGSTTKATVGNWFKNFRDGDFSLANEPRGRPKTKVDNDHLRAVVESDPSQSTRELASIFNVSIPTILVHLAAI
ncbi:hypothetical protein DMN91_007606, partial [Ooceraea biroi]